MKGQSKTSKTGANGGDAVSAAAHDAASAVSREFNNVIADAEDLLRATTSLTGEELVRIRAQLAKGIATAKESVEEMGGSVADSARQASASTDAYVHQQPWKAIGVTAAAAFVLGLLVARR